MGHLRNPEEHGLHAGSADQRGEAVVAEPVEMTRPPMRSNRVMDMSASVVYSERARVAVTALVGLPGAWVAPGRWATDLAYALWFVALGGLVTQRARRWAISWCFLAAYLGLIATRVLWLGQAPAIWFHQLQGGALL